MSQANANDIAPEAAAPQITLDTRLMPQGSLVGVLTRESGRIMAQSGDDAPCQPQPGFVTTALRSRVTALFTGSHQLDKAAAAAKMAQVQQWCEAVLPKKNVSTCLGLYGEFVQADIARAIMAGANAKLNGKRPDLMAHLAMAEILNFADEREDRAELMKEVCSELKILVLYTQGFPDVDGEFKSPQKRKEYLPFKKQMKALTYEIQNVKVVHLPPATWTGNTQDDNDAINEPGTGKTTGSNESNGSREQEILDAQQRNPKASGRTPVQLVTQADAEDHGLQPLDGIIFWTFWIRSWSFLLLIGCRFLFSLIRCRSFFSPRVWEATPVSIVAKYLCLC